MTTKLEVVEAESVQPATGGAMVRSSASTAEVALRTVERLVKSGTSIEQLERFIALQERMLAQVSKQEADEAFAEMQAKLPTIDHKGKITVEGNVRSTFAKYEDIVDQVRPFLKEHGFSFRHETSYVEGVGMLEVKCILSHRRGFDRVSSFRSFPDPSGNKSDVHADASARSYLKRYTLLDVLGVATRGADRDGNRHEDAGDDRPARRQSAGAERGDRPATGQQQAAAPRSYSSAGDTRPITEPQLKRLATIMAHAKRPDNIVKAWAFGRYGVTSRKNLNREQYDDFCKAIEAPGELPGGTFVGAAKPAQQRDREPGEEG